MCWAVLEKVEQTQREAVLEASAEIAERLARGGAWHIMAVSYTHLDVYKRQVYDERAAHR